MLWNQSCDSWPLTQECCHLSMKSSCIIPRLGNHHWFSACCHSSSWKPVRMSSTFGFICLGSLRTTAYSPSGTIVQTTFYSIGGTIYAVQWNFYMLEIIQLLAPFIGSQIMPFWGKELIFRFSFANISVFIDQKDSIMKITRRTTGARGYKLEQFQNIF